MDIPDDTAISILVTHTEKLAYVYKKTYTVQCS